MHALFSQQVTASQSEELWDKVEETDVASVKILVMQLCMGQWSQD